MARRKGGTRREPVFDETPEVRVKPQDRPAPTSAPPERRKRHFHALACPHI
jgi:hypothetical protein